MLVQTNDAFSGINSVRLHRIKNMRMFQRRAYDAGSEVNNQLATHIPGPCCMNPFVRAPEGELIRVHPGIQDDVGNLNVLEHGWKGKVAKITIKRVAS